MPEARAADVEWLELPAFVAGETPWLRSDDGGLSLSWVAHSGGEFLLRASRYANGQWREPVTVARGSGWFNNAADFARVMPLGGGVQLAVWLELTSFRDLYYRPAAALSTDGGASWRALGHPAGSEDYGQQGFVSAARPGGNVVLFWIGGFRGEALLWRSPLAVSGEWAEPRALDRYVCTCCRTAAAPSGALLYRDRDADEIRDIALIEAAAVMETSELVHADGWRIAGCPVNGPAIAEAGSRRAIAWFTGAGERPETRLRVEPGDAAGYLPIAGGRSRGRVDVAWLDESRLALSTVTRNRGIEIRLLDAAGETPVIRRTLRIAAKTGLGSPTLAVAGDALYLAFHDADDGAIRVARIDVSAARR